MFPGFVYIYFLLTTELKFVKLDLFFFSGGVVMGGAPIGAGGDMTPHF